jgi:hypothetical protein
MKKLRLGAVLLLLCGMVFASTASFTQPRLAIFLSKTSYHLDVLSPSRIAFVHTEH